MTTAIGGADETEDLRNARAAVQKLLERDATLQVNSHRLVRQAVERGVTIASATAQKRIITFLAVLLAACVLAVAVLTYALMYRFPIKQWLWTNDARAVCYAVPLGQPNISEAALKNFVGEAAVALHSFDYLNYARFIDAAADRYMTPGGAARYKVSLQEAGTLQRAIDSWLSSTSVVAAPPVITQQGVENGRYFWIVQAPIIIFYANKIETKRDAKIFIAKVVRIEPSPLNTNGVAIDGVEERVDVNERRK